MPTCDENIMPTCDVYVKDQGRLVQSPSYVRGKIQDLDLYLRVEKERESETERQREREREREK